MYNFRYVTKNEKKELKNELIDLIKSVQNEVRPYFTFRFDFIGSEQLNMVTCDFKSNIGFDFDVNIRVNDDDENYSAKEIKHNLMNAFNKHLKKYGYDNCEDSTRVISFKVKDHKNKRILHSCDVAIVNDCEDGREQYIRFNKASNTYTWEYQPEGYYKLGEKIEFIKKNNLWQQARDLYLDKKNNNTNLNKKSRSLRAETFNDIYKRYN